MHTCKQPITVARDYEREHSEMELLASPPLPIKVIIKSCNIINGLTKDLLTCSYLIFSVPRCSYWLLEVLICLLKVTVICIYLMSSLILYLKAQTLLNSLNNVNNTKKRKRNTSCNMAEINLQGHIETII